MDVMFTSQSYSLCAKGLVLLLLLMMMYPGQVLACSCGYDPSLTEEERVLENSHYHEIVFLGKVVKTRAYRPNTIEYSTSDPVYITFAVRAVYKGNIASEFTLTTSGDGSSCGYNFAPGKTYLVFVSDEYQDGSWNSGLCSGNQLDPATSLLAVLGEGALPRGDGDSEETWPEEEAVMPTGELLPS